MKTLLEVASTLGNLVSKKAPKRAGPKGGNLKKRLKEANTGRKILGSNSAQAEKKIINDLKSGTNTFEFGIDVAPPGAEYGQFWNDPTVSKTVKKGKTKNIPDGINYGSKAYESPEFQKELDAYIDSLTDKLFESISKQIDKELK
jgi:hypothetical protein